MLLIYKLKHLFPVLWGVALGEELLGHVVMLCFTLGESARMVGASSHNHPTLLSPSPPVPKVLRVFLEECYCGLTLERLVVLVRDAGNIRSFTYSSNVF